MHDESSLRLIPTSEADRTYIARLNFLTDTFGDEHGTLADDFDTESDYYVRDWNSTNGGFIAWRGWVPAGGVWLLWGTDERHGFGYVAEEIPELALAVEGRYTGQGVGTALLDRAAELARKLGAPAVSLSVHPDNARAHRLYTFRGFEPTGIIREGHPVLMKRW